MRASTNAGLRRPVPICFCPLTSSFNRGRHPFATAFSLWYVEVESACVGVDQSARLPLVLPLAGAGGPAMNACDKRVTAPGSDTEVLLPSALCPVNEASFGRSLEPPSPSAKAGVGQFCPAICADRLVPPCA